MALEPHSNYLSLRMLTNLKFTWGICAICWVLCAENGEVDCVLEAVLSMTETGNEKQQVSLSLGNADFL